MTNEEMKMLLKKNGVSDENIEKTSAKYDAEKITEIVESASNQKEAIMAIHKLYPELEVSRLEESMTFMQDQLESAVKEQYEQGKIELSSEELENVAGGGFFDAVGSFFKNHWKAILIGAAIVVGVALAAGTLGAGVGFLGGLAVFAEGSTSIMGMALGTLGLGATALGGGFVGAAAVGGAICGALFGIAGGVEILKNTDGWKS